MQALQIEQQHLTRKNELMRAIVASMQDKEIPRLEMVKPEMFDGHALSPERLIAFYEYASDKNFWKSEQDRIKNTGLFLTDLSKEWYVLRLVDLPDASWSEWTAIFLTSFKSNPIDGCGQAIFYN